MLNSCIDIFQKMTKDHLEQFLIDHYTPANGTYLIYQETDNGFCKTESYEVQTDKKTGKVSLTDHERKKIAELDYPSQLIDTNKALGQKIILSNNFLSFFVKKENLSNGKLTDEIVDTYYKILENPYAKYKNAKDKALYQLVEQKAGPVNQEKIEKIKKWIKQNIFSIQVSGKDYLKIFFICESVDINLEGERYTLPNFYNKNDYNQSIGEEIMGLPNQNMGMNSKKPYLESKQRKFQVPLLLNTENAMVRKKFFDYLWGEASRGKYYIYVDLNENKIETRNNLKEDRCYIENGYFLYIRKDKNEAAIEDMDIISGYHDRLKKPFIFSNVLGMQENRLEGHGYGESYTRTGLLAIINDLIYSRYLVNQFFTEIKDIAPKDNPVLRERIIQDRGTIFSWAYKGRNQNICQVIVRATYSILLNNLMLNQDEKVKHVFNFYISLKAYFEGGTSEMADIMVEIRSQLRDQINGKEYHSLKQDEAYFYAVGQIIAYFISLNKSGKKTHALLNPFLSLKTDEQLKEKLRGVFLKYNYAIETNSLRFKNLYTMITAYVPEGKINRDYLIAGYISNSLIYEKREEE